MKAYHRKFIIQLLVISVIIYGAFLLVSSKLNLPVMTVTVMIALLFAINSLAFIFVTNTKGHNPRGFVYSYMTVSFGRLIICSGFVFLYALTHRPLVKPFAISFFVLYFIYTIAEVRAIYAFFKS
jgi:hypothetical protein